MFRDDGQVTEMIIAGGKFRTREWIVPYLVRDSWSVERQHYYEPFLGGCNVMVDVPFRHRHGSDINEYLISLYKYVQAGGTLPFRVSREEWLRVKNDKGSYPSWYVGYCGYICSYRGVFFSGYADVSSGSDGLVRDYCATMRNSLLKMFRPVYSGGMLGVDLRSCSYDSLVDLPDRSMVYCDPPYRYSSKDAEALHRGSVLLSTDKVLAYGLSTGFDYDRFYSWCLDLSRKGHTVFISEYWMPSDSFKVVGQWCIRNQLSPVGKKGFAVERLYVPRV